MAEVAGVGVIGNNTSTAPIEAGVGAELGKMSKMLDKLRIMFGHQRTNVQEERIKIFGL